MKGKHVLPGCSLWYGARAPISSSKETHWVINKKKKCKQREISLEEEGNCGERDKRAMRSENDQKTS